MAKMTLITEFYPLLQALTKIKDEKCRHKCLKALAKDERFAACMKEIATNLMDENIQLTVKDKRKINKHATVVRSLAKSEKISQSGGFLNIVVPLLASVVAELLARK